MKPLSSRQSLEARLQPNNQASPGAIGYFLLIFVFIVLVTAMGIFSSVKKESEHAVFSRFKVSSRLNNEGALTAARMNLPAWNAGATTTYDVYVDSQTPTTITIECIGVP